MLLALVILQCSHSKKISSNSNLTTQAIDSTKFTYYFIEGCNERMKGNLEIAEKHKQASLDILEIRESLLSLLIDIRINKSEIEIFQQRRDKLNEELVKTYRGVPKTISKAYKIASKALKDNEEFTISDSEIDKFLPENLRRN